MTAPAVDGFDGADGHRYTCEGDQWIRVRKVDKFTAIREEVSASDLPELADPLPPAPNAVDPHTRVSAEMFQPA